MYRLYAIFFVLIIKNCGATEIHLEELNLTANGAPSVTPKNNLSVTTTPKTVKVFILTDDQFSITTKVEERELNGNATAVTNSPMVFNIPKAVPGLGDKKKRPGEVLKRVKPQHKVVHAQTSSQLAVPPVKEISSNAIDSRRMSKFDVYVPISEDLIKPDNDPLGRGLSLIDLNGNNMRLPL